MKENILDIDNKFAREFFVKALSEAGDRVKNVSEPIEVELLVNGVSVPFSETLNILYRELQQDFTAQADATIKTRVRERISSFNLGEISGHLEDLRDFIEGAEQAVEGLWEALTKGDKS